MLCGSWTSARNRSSPPHWGQAVVGSPNVRALSSRQGQYRQPLPFGTPRAPAAPGSSSACV
jgi:hypothetical protein